MPIRPRHPRCVERKRLYRLQNCLEIWSDKCVQIRVWQECCTLIDGGDVSTTRNQLRTNLFGIYIHPSLLFQISSFFFDANQMSTGNIPQSEPLRVDQVENNAGKDGDLSLTLLHGWVFQEDSLGRSMICNVSNVFSVWAQKVVPTIKVKSDWIF